MTLLVLARKVLKIPVLLILGHPVYCFGYFLYSGSNIIPGFPDYSTQKLLSQHFLETQFQEVSLNYCARHNLILSQGIISSISAYKTDYTD